MVQTTRTVPYFDFLYIIAGAFVPKVVNASSTLIASASVELAVRGNSGYGSSRIHIADESIAEGWYYVTMKPTTTSNVSRYVSSFTSNQLNGRHMRDQCCLATRTDGGAWTDTANSQMFIGVEIEPVISVGSAPRPRIISPYLAGNA